MHVRMAHAYNSERNAEVVAQAVQNPTKDERLQFRCWYCRDIPVEFVSGRTDKNGVFVRAHFRRSRDHAEHHAFCKFDFAAQLTSWRGRAAEIITQSKKKLILSLNNLIAGYAQRVPPTGMPYTASPLSSETPPIVPKPAEKLTPQEWAKRERLMRLTCHAAQELWHLARIADGDSTVPDRVILKLDSRTIDWSEFFFRHDVEGDLTRLWSIVRQHDEVPVCILGRVHTVQTGVIPQREKGRPYDRMELKWSKVALGGRFAVRIGTRVPLLASRFSPGDEIIACGKLVRQENTRLALPGTKVYAWLWVQVAEQIAKRDDGGSALPPMNSMTPTLFD